jgi:hypothetical protein
MQAQAVIGQSMTPSGAQALAARNLDLLRAIENTVDCLVADTNLVRSICATYEEIQTKLSSSQTVIDPTGHICSVLEKASGSCARIYEDSKKRHMSAVRDPQLRSDDGVVDAYDEFMVVINQLHDTIEELCDWIATHDAVLQPTTGETFASVDSLFDALLSKK